MINQSRYGAVVRALASCQCRWGSILAEFHMCVEFVVGFSPGSPVFLFPEKKNIISKFQVDLDRGLARKPAKADVASSLNIVIKRKERCTRLKFFRFALIYDNYLVPAPHSFYWT